jgi:hypothetical protein
VGRAQRREDIARLEAEVAAARPYLGLAREIQHEVDRLSADPSVAGDSLTDAIDAIPRRERLALARTIFDHLPAEKQWAIIEDTLDDAELREVLTQTREQHADAVRHAAGYRLIGERARAANRFDTREIAEGDALTVGLFREADVHDAIPRGHRSTVCARRLVLVGTCDDALLHVMDDVYNPGGGLFVTPDYDETVWRSTDRLDAHTLVRAGSLVGSKFEPILYAGGRADFEVDGAVVPGRLHVGYVMLGEYDVFAQIEA